MLELVKLCIGIVAAVVFLGGLVFLEIKKPNSDPRMRWAIRLCIPLMAFMATGFAIPEVTHFILATVIWNHLVPNLGMVLIMGGVLGFMVYRRASLNTSHIIGTLAVMAAVFLIGNLLSTRVGLYRTANIHEPTVITEFPAQDAKGARFDALEYFAHRSETVLKDYQRHQVEKEFVRSSVIDSGFGYIAPLTADPEHGNRWLFKSAGFVVNEQGRKTQRMYVIDQETTYAVDSPWPWTPQHIARRADWFSDFQELRFSIKDDAVYQIIPKTFRSPSALGSVMHQTGVCIISPNGTPLHLSMAQAKQEEEYRNFPLYSLQYFTHLVEAQTYARGILGDSWYFKEGRPVISYPKKGFNKPPYVFKGSDGAPWGCIPCHADGKPQHCMVIYLMNLYSGHFFAYEPEQLSSADVAREEFYQVCEEITSVRRGSSGGVRGAAGWDVMPVFAGKLCWGFALAADDLTGMAGYGLYYGGDGENGEKPYRFFRSRAAYQLFLELANSGEYALKDLGQTEEELLALKERREIIESGGIEKVSSRLSRLTEELIELTKAVQILEAEQKAKHAEQNAEKKTDTDESVESP